MGLFDTPAVKELKKRAEYIGALHGQAHLGHLSRHDVADVVEHEGQRLSLREAFMAAAADIGDDRAVKAAVKSANIGADSYARLGNTPYRDVVKRAESSIREMLGR